MGLVGVPCQPRQLIKDRPIGQSANGPILKNPMDWDLVEHFGLLQSAQVVVGANGSRVRDRYSVRIDMRRVPTLSIFFTLSL